MSDGNAQNCTGRVIKYLSVNQCSAQYSMANTKLGLKKMLPSNELPVLNDRCSSPANSFQVSVIITDIYKFHCSTYTRTQA
jgi:hypothetical protein